MFTNIHQYEACIPIHICTAYHKYIRVCMHMSINLSIYIYVRISRRMFAVLLYILYTYSYMCVYMYFEVWRRLGKIIFPFKIDMCVMMINE